MAAAPRYRTQAWRDIGIGALLVTVWICSWFALTVATSIAGGDPSVSPVAFINPSTLVRRFASSMGPLQWWVLVKPTSTVVVWKFWTALSLIVCTVTVGVIGTRMQLARLATGPLGQLLPAARRVVRTGRWARAADLRSLRGRPGRRGVFLVGQHGRRPLVTLPE